jgi:hypothetical protein
LKNKILSLVLVFTAGVCCAQAAPPSHDTGTSASAVSSWSASAIWRPDASFLPAAHTACDHAQPPAGVAGCFIAQMEKAGAPADAVKFTQALYQATSEVGMMGEFKGFPPVGLAWVVYPLRANNNDGILMLNGSPAFVDPDDLQKLDTAALAQDAIFLDWKKTVPKLALFPGDRAGGGAQIQYARVWPGDKPGQQKFLFTYPLADGCRECARSGFANYWWIFDGSGKFAGTKLLSVSRGVPPLRRRGAHSHPPATPATETAAPAPAATDH